MGIIHLDAHFDLCDEIDGDYLSHGSTESRALELKNISDIGSIFFLGVRSVETQELPFIRDKKINILKAMDIRRQGVGKSLEKIREKMKKFSKIYLTVDIDMLDPLVTSGEYLTECGK